MIWLIFGTLLLLVAQMSAVIILEYSQNNKNSKMVSKMTKSYPNSRTLVLYYSRSGSTELMAYKIAEIKKAKVINLVADEYKLGIKGWFNAMLDARKTDAVITPEKIDLTAYDTIYAGAPIWLYSPAPPVYEFVKHNDLTGKKVILFNSLNNKFEQKYIDTFGSLVNKQGGQFIDHVYVVRGRMTQQMDQGAFLEAIENELDNN